MKTYNNLYVEVCSLRNLELAYRKARKRKSKKPYVIEFEKNLQQELKDLKRELESLTYKPRSLKRFIVRDPKTRTIQELKIHDHTCLIFNNTAEFFHCAVPFVRGGLNNNEKCYVIIDDITREDVLRNFKNLFKNGQIPIEEFNHNGRIKIEHFKNIYLMDGVFDMERTIKNYIELTKKMIQEGFSGVRVIAEISSSLKDLINQYDFLTYESNVDKYFPENNFLAICAYSKKHFSTNYLSEILKVHPIEIDVLNTRL